MLLGTPKQDANKFFISLKSPPDDWDSIVLSSPPNLSSKWSKTGKFPKNPLWSVITFFFNDKIKKKIVTLNLHVLRSLCPNGSQKHMHLACWNPHPKCLICLYQQKYPLTGIIPLHPLYPSPLDIWGGGTSPCTDYVSVDLFKDL